jgi:hypothetical protein
MANVPCTPASISDAACARTFVTSFGRRAWRRPLTDEEVVRYATVATGAASLLNDFWKGLACGVSGLLQSPHFLYRAEIGAPDPADGTRRRLDGYELAARLSYLLWDTTPDAELLAAAGDGRLASAAGLGAQADRLLGSPRARPALQTFFADRLRLDDLAGVMQPAGTFKQLTPTLLSSMKKETLGVIDDLVSGRDADVRELIDGSSTFVNDELAALYGLPKPGKADPIKVTLPAASPRAGYLGQGSFLALTSHPVVTSPTRRGKFIREVVMCQTIPPPPPNVNAALPPNTAGARTMRERLELHRADPACNSCHAMTDPVGLAFESFDAIGGYRTSDGGLPIDASGVLDGASYADAASFAHLLRARPETSECLVRGYFRYLSGHVEAAGEEPAIAGLVAGFQRSGFRFRALVKAAVDSPAFSSVARANP